MARPGQLIVLAVGTMVLCLAIPGRTTAQELAQAPQSLAPQGRPQDQSAPRPVPSEPSLPAAPSGPASVLPIGVESAPLSPLDPDSVGPLTRDQGGFGYDMWAGSRRGIVEIMLPGMPARSVSPTLRGLMRRLLLSNAKAPDGEAKEKSLIVLRVEQLAAMGDAAGVESLLRVAPTRATDPALLRAEADMLFLENDNARVCPLVASQSGTTSAPYWREADIFCQALAGERDRAALGATLLREQGSEDRLFYDLLDALNGIIKPRIDSMANALPLHFAMARAAKVPLPADVVTSNNPSILRTVATAPSLANELRLDAAERAEAMGVIEAKTLREIYASISFTKDQLANALTTAQTDRTPVSRALLYRRAVEETVPTALAQILQQALTMARSGGRYQSQARVYRDLVAGLAPTRDLIWLAPEATRALLAAGDVDGVNAWLNVLRASAVLDEKAARTRDRLVALARIAGALSDEDWTNNSAAAWFAAASVTDDGTPVDVEDMRTQATLTFNLLEALGDTVPDAQWERTMAARAGAALMPNAALWRQLGAAAVSGRIAETVMLGAVSIGPGPIVETDSTVLRFVIESLRGVGLVGEARALAVEAAVAAGI